MFCPEDTVFKEYEVQYMFFFPQNRLTFVRVVENIFYIGLVSLFCYSILLRFLMEAVSNLDNSNAITREHKGKVLLDLVKKLSAYCDEASNHSAYNETIRNMKILRMAAMNFIQSDPIAPSPNAHNTSAYSLMNSSKNYGYQL